MVWMPHWPVLLGQGKLEPGTERVKTLLSRIGNPEKHLPPVVHVAGTNGKGSTITFLRAILTAAGYRVHVYTSPHLFEFNERVVLAGDKVSDTALYTALETCRIAADGMPVTMFEGTTAAAFQLFAEHEADVLLIETGLGGRLDATNVIEKPAATVITPISLDHKEYLGPDLGTIAAEKAGIARAGVPCIIAPQEQQAIEVLSVMAYKAGASLFRYGYEWGVAEADEGLLFISDERQVPFPLPALEGGHQLVNAATAVATLTRLAGFTVTDAAIRQGLQTAYWPARLQRIHKGLARLLPEGWELWLDGAHNEGGATVLSQWALHHQDKALCLVFGTTRGKDIRSFLRYFNDIAKIIYVVHVKSEPNSYTIEEMNDLAEEEKVVVVPAESIEDAILHSTRTIQMPTRVLVCGSLFLAKDVAEEGRLVLV